MRILVNTLTCWTQVRSNKYTSNSNNFNTRASRYIEIRYDSLKTMFTNKRFQVWACYTHQTSTKHNTPGHVQIKYIFWDFSTADCWSLNYNYSNHQIECFYNSVIPELLASIQVSTIHAIYIHICILFIGKVTQDNTPSDYL